MQQPRSEDDGPQHDQSEGRCLQAGIDVDPGREEQDEAPAATTALLRVRGSVTRIHTVAAAQAAAVSFETTGRGTPNHTHGVCHTIHAKLVNPSTGIRPGFQTGPNPCARFSL